MELTILVILVCEGIAHMARFIIVKTNIRHFGVAFPAILSDITADSLHTSSL